MLIIPNDRLFDLCDKKIGVDGAFKLADEVLCHGVQAIAEVITVPGLINLDFADVKAIMGNGGICAVGFGEGSGDMKVEEATERALDSQLLDIGDVSRANGILVHLEGGEDMTLEDVNRAGELVLTRVSPSAKVAWGARINPELDGRLRATVVLAGVQSPFLRKRSSKKITKPSVKKVSSKKSSPKKASTKKAIKKIIDRAREKEVKESPKKKQRNKKPK